MNNYNIEVTTEGHQVLVSYETPVAAKVGSTFYRTTKRYSRTTDQHIARFLNGAWAQPVSPEAISSLFLGITPDKPQVDDFCETLGIVVVVDMGTVIDRFQKLQLTSEQISNAEDTIMGKISSLPYFKWFGSSPSSLHGMIGYMVGEPTILINGAMPVTLEVPEGTKDIAAFVSRATYEINTIIDKTLEKAGKRGKN